MSIDLNFTQISLEDEFLLKLVYYTNSMLISFLLLTIGMFANLGNIYE